MANQITVPPSLSVFKFIQKLLNTERCHDNMTAVHHDERLRLISVGQVQDHLFLIGNGFELSDNVVSRRKDPLYSVFDNISLEAYFYKLSTLQSSTLLKYFAASSGGVGLI